jgi:predicted ATP-dependent endonuclease of OLD family
MEHLQLDMNFRELSLSELAELENEHTLIEQATSLFKTLSSGHAAVLYYLTHVVELVENKTICLFDEPENHLHPPLLSAFIRTLSTLLTENNGMAIMATHSPVVLQEIPRLCTWKLHHINDGKINVRRPNIETFGESVGEITAEVFSLDLRKTGFYALLEKDSLESKSVERVLSMYENQVGLEGRAVIYATIKG